MGLFYGSDTGTTQKVAKTIKGFFDDETMSAPVDAMKASAKDILAYDHLILGTPTVGIGELPADWEALMEKLVSTDLSGKTVAVFGLGDQFCYADSYADAMGELADFFAERGARVVGDWPTDGYEHAASLAVRNGRFIGLALDEDNQPEQTPDRLKAWLNLIAPEFGLDPVH
ncbi:MAG: flavodoxin [Rhodospirillaceae bacterium]|nr:flavodoxin [Rhodospirillaceae bacterium]